MNLSKQVCLACPANFIELLDKKFPSGNALPSSLPAPETGDLPCNVYYRSPEPLHKSMPRL